MGAWTWAFIDESRSIGDCLSPVTQVSVHPLGMAHMVERPTLMLTIFGNFISTGESQEIQCKDLNIRLTETCIPWKCTWFILKINLLVQKVLLTLQQLHPTNTE